MVFSVSITSTSALTLQDCNGFSPRTGSGSRVLISLDAQCPHQSVFRTVAKQQGHIINLSLYKIIIKNWPGS